MPLCEGCGASYSEAFERCDYCGRSKTKPQELKITIQSSSDFACPYCHMADKIEKVSMISIHQTSVTQSIVPTTQTTVDKNGKFHTTVSDVLVSSTNTSELSGKLAAPKKPSQPTESMVAFIPVILLVIVGACIILVNTGNSKSSFGSIFCAGILFILAIFAFFAINKKSRIEYQKKVKAANIQLEKWERAVKNWNELYYCFRDGNVFIPGQDKSAPLAEMLQFIYSI